LFFCFTLLVKIKVTSSYDQFSFQAYFYTTA
jgi:hypothetical protein